MHGWVSVENDLRREVQTQEGISEPKDGNNPHSATASEMPKGDGTCIIQVQKNASSEEFMGKLRLG